MARLRPFALAAALMLAAVPAASAGTATSVAVAKSGALGEILVSAGRTLYETSGSCAGSCTSRWLPLVIARGVRPVAGRGVSQGLLGTKQRADGRLQVTYRGIPLYRFAGDAAAGQVNGLGGAWHAVSPTGAAVAKPAAASMSTTTTSGASMGSAPSASANPGMWCAANPKSCVNGVPVTTTSG